MLSTVLLLATLRLTAIAGPAKPPRAPPPPTSAAPAEAPPPVPPNQPVRAQYIFNLADFMGDVKGSFLSLAYDRDRDEVYVWGGLEVQLFGETGMLIHSFGTAQGVGGVRAVAPLPNGDLIVAMSSEGRERIVRCNYRGDIVAPFTPSGLPPDVALGMDRIRSVAGRLYFLDMRGYRAVVTDEDGRYLFHRDLVKAVFSQVEDVDEQPDTENIDVTGFDVDYQGNILLTVAAQFRGLVVSPDGQVRSFGGKGSRPGKFNIAGAIAADENGYIYAADALRSVILVFTPDLKFLFEFGGRGESPGRLAVPTSIVVGNGKVFVGQGRNRGITVYKLL